MLERRAGRGDPERRRCERTVDRRRRRGIVDQIGERVGRQQLDTAERYPQAGGHDQNRPDGCMPTGLVKGSTNRRPTGALTRSGPLETSRAAATANSSVITDAARNGTDSEIRPPPVAGRPCAARGSRPPTTEPSPSARDYRDLAAGQTRLHYAGADAGSVRRVSSPRTMIPAVRTTTHAPPRAQPPQAGSWGDFPAGRA